MKPEQLSELLSSYLDGEVTERERAVVERALRDDPSARRLLEELRAVAHAVAGLPRHAAPATLESDLAAQLERSALIGGDDEPFSHRTARGSNRASRFAVAAMFGVVVLAGWWFLVHDGGKSSGGPGQSIVMTDSNTTRSPAEAITPATGDAIFRRSRARESDDRAQPLPVESRIAAGVAPKELLTQSFGVETVRLQVAATNTVERDAMASRLADRLTRRNTENLARRDDRSAGQKERIQSFYLVGKPGVNFADARQQQVLVRVPRSEAAAVVDELAAVAGAEDRIELRAGPIAVKGAETARVLLRGEERKDAAAASDDQVDQVDAIAASKPNSDKEPAGFNLLTGLMKVVGLAEKSKGPMESKAEPEEADADRTAVAAGRDATADESATEDLRSIPAPDSASAKSGTRSRSLVDSRRAEAEKSSPAARSARAKRLDDTPPATIVTAMMKEEVGAGNNVAETDEYVTIVIEFVIPARAPALSPKNQPTPPRPTNSPR